MALEANYRLRINTSQPAGFEQCISMFARSWEGSGEQWFCSETKKILLFIVAGLTST